MRKELVGQLLSYGGSVVCGYFILVDINVVVYLVIVTQRFTSCA